jgi:hypothetical protein
MWFAALGDVNGATWLIQLINRLFYNSPAALTLFTDNPFPTKAPDYIRIQAYSYNFTTLDTHIWKGGDESNFLSNLVESVQTGKPEDWWVRKK